MDEWCTNTKLFSIYLYGKLTPMMKITKMLLVLTLLFGTAVSTLADRGIGRKSKNKVELNISTPSTLRGSIFFNLRSGLKYTGSLLSKQQTVTPSFFYNTLVTYQKGNSIYIIPYKQITAVPEVRSGYTGMKIIIRPH